MYFCVLHVEILWFWMCLRQVAILCHFCLFLSCVLGVLNSPVPTPAHGLLVQRPCLRLWFILENTSLLELSICATTHGPTSQSFNSGSFHCGPCHCSYIFIFRYTIQNMSRARRLTQCDCCGICYILPNQQIFRKYCILFFHNWRNGFAGRIKWLCVPHLARGP